MAISQPPAFHARLTTQELLSWHHHTFTCVKASDSNTHTHVSLSQARWDSPLSRKCYEKTTAFPHRLKPVTQTCQPVQTRRADILKSDKVTQPSFKGMLWYQKRWKNQFWPGWLNPWVWSVGHTSFYNDFLDFSSFSFVIVGISWVNIYCGLTA